MNKYPLFIESVKEQIPPSSTELDNAYFFFHLDINKYQVIKASTICLASIITKSEEDYNAKAVGLRRHPKKEKDKTNVMTLCNILRERRSIRVRNSS